MSGVGPKPNGPARKRPRAMIAIALAALLTAISAPAQVQFADVTLGSGVEYTGESYGASWGDVNGDQLPDLFVNHHRYLPGLYINQGDGTFENREFEIDVWQTVPRSDTHGGTFADYNNDGFLDLVITAGSKNFTQFLKNNGSFLTDRITDFTFDRQSWGARLPLWFDFSNDGLLDLGIVVQGAKVQLHEQVGGDFERSNAASGHECFNGDYSHLSDLTMDDQLDWVCISHDSGSPERIYDYTVGVPFLDQTALAVPVANVIDSAIADFDGDQIMDLFLLRGKVRINGAEIVAPNSIEAHLTNSNGQDAGITFESAGDLTIELHWSARNVGQIFIGAGGLNPDPVEPDVPISFTLSASDPDVVGTVPYDPMLDRGIYIGYDPATQTWTYFNSPGTGSFSYTYSYIDSTAPMSNLNVFGIRAQETPRTPSMLKFDGAQYTDQIAFTGLNETVLCNSVAAADYDNDGDVDLYYVCRDAVSNLANRLYLNDGTGVFSAAALPFGAEGPVGPGVGLGENVVASDYDVDGFVDLFVTNGLKLYPMLIGYTAGGPDKLFRNLGNSNNWIQLDLTGTTSNRDGLGAIVTATSGGKTQRREQNGGYHRWAQHDTRIHFGLGVNLTVDLSVQWPSGIVDNYLEVPVNAVYEIVEGSATITPVAIPTSTPPSVCAETAGPPDYDPNVDRELFIWKDDCGSNNWKVRVTGGAGPTMSYLGQVESELPFLSVAGVKLETSDTLDYLSDPAAIDYGLTVAAGREDGFDFTVDPTADTCFGVNSNVATALGGSQRTPLVLPFDLATLGPCEGEPGADLVTVKTLSSGNPTPMESDVVSFLITVTNNGPTVATGVALTDFLPAGLTATSNNGLRSQGAYNDATGIWDIGTLGVAASATLTLEGTVDVGQAGNTITNTTSAGAGDQMDPNSAGDDLSETIVIDGISETPLTEWVAASGGVTTVHNQIVYSGVPTGWINNSVVTPPLSSLGFPDNYVIEWTIDTDPAGTTWVVGLGIDETTANWRDVDFALRSSDGIFKVYESGLWRTTGPQLAQGDVIAIAVNSGSIEYRVNNLVILTSTYSGQPDFYVDTSFNEGAISLSAVIVGNPMVVPEPQETPITGWVAITGGVGISANDLSYSGSPIGWAFNTANSVPLSSMGASDNFSVRWEIASEPASSIWVFGLGVSETDSSWRDVDYSLRCSDGLLQVYENGIWAATDSYLSVGDVLSIHVEDSRVEYQLNGATFHATGFGGTPEFYIDSSFKQGAIDLTAITLVQY